VAKLSLGWMTGIARGLLIERYGAAFQQLPRRHFWQRSKEDLSDLPDFTRVVDPALAVAALNQLPDAERVVVSLRYLDDLRLPEIAAITEQSLSTVESLLQRGRAAFEQVYLEHGDADARSNVGSAGVGRPTGFARSPILGNPASIGAD
jgi:RNA polymerase sigma-70 factor (ECF subfamily)